MRSPCAPVLLAMERTFAAEASIQDSSFAYSLSQAEAGWVWRVFDEMGDIVAAGDAPDQRSAERLVQLAFAGALR